jgi:dTDP-4-dehydrorhamnose reductase
MKKTILIFGVSSFVGSNMLESLKDDFRIIGTYFKTPVSWPGITCLPCDVLKKDYVLSLVARFRPDFILYAVGISSLKKCHQQPHQAEALNSAGVVNCCSASDRYNSKFIYLSSAFVLGGEKTLYREQETPFPESTYGNTLSTTEFYVQRSSLNFLILRCPVLYGRSYNSLRENWFDSLQSAFARGESVGVNDSVHLGFLDVKLLAKILQAIISKDVSNQLLHVSSKDIMTRYEFAKLYAKVFKKNESQIQKVTSQFPRDKKLSSSENNVLYFQLDTSGLEEFLQEKMPSVEESLNYTYKRLSL